MTPYQRAQWRAKRASVERKLSPIEAHAVSAAVVMLIVLAIVGTVMGYALGRKDALEMCRTGKALMLKDGTFKCVKLEVRSRA